MRYRLGDPLVDRYLEFVAGRARANTLRAVAFDLKTFFTVVARDPREVASADVFEFLAQQRGDRVQLNRRARRIFVARLVRTARLVSPTSLREWGRGLGMQPATRRTSGRFQSPS